MTYRASFIDDDKLDLPAALIAETGLRPGDVVSDEARENSVLLAQDLSRARSLAASRGYSVDPFLAKRRRDGRERRTSSIRRSSLIAALSASYVGDATAVARPLSVWN